MIRQHGFRRIGICDECGDEFEVLGGDFRDLIESLKAEGWTVRPTDEGGWEHKCPDCKPGEESPLERARRLLEGT